MMSHAGYFFLLLAVIYGAFAVFAVLVVRQAGFVELDGNYAYIPAGIFGGASLLCLVGWAVCYGQA